jgi:hypothetical protein
VAKSKQPKSTPAKPARVKPTDGPVTHLILITSDVGDYADDDAREDAFDGSTSVELHTSEAEATAAFNSWRAGRTNMDVILVKVEKRGRGRL